jgi:hypothetical protein
MASTPSCLFSASSVEAMPSAFFGVLFHALIVSHYPEHRLSGLLVMLHLICEGARFLGACAPMGGIIK